MGSEAAVADGGLGAAAARQEGARVGGGDDNGFAGSAQRRVGGGIGNGVKRPVTTRAAASDAGV